MIRHRSRIALGTGIVLAVLVWFVLIAVQALRLRADVQAGMSAADAARDASGGVEGLLQGRQSRDLQRAQGHFTDAHRRARNPVLAPLRFLPVAGRQLRAVDAMSVAAGEIATVGIEGLAEVREAVKTPLQSGPERITLLRRLADTAETARLRLAGLDLGPDHALLSPVADAQNDLAQELRALRSALTGARSAAVTVADLLEGPHRYLVLGANNAEMRAGAGMPLSLGELETHGGRMRLVGFRSIHEVKVPEGSVPLGGDFAARWGWLTPNQEWRNLLASPRFDVSGPLAARMWEAAGNGPVDGVLLVDPLVLQAMLAATGPVEVGGREITSDNVVDELLIEQYLRFPETQVEQRRDQLGAVAETAVAALDRGEWSLSRLAAGLTGAARGRHLMAWSKSPSNQDGWRAAGIAGSLHQDSLLVSVLNRGGNKLDRYLRVQAELELKAENDNGAGVVRLMLRNEAPSEGPKYVLGPHPDIGASEGEYIGILAVNVCPEPPQPARLTTSLRSLLLVLMVPPASSPSRCRSREARSASSSCASTFPSTARSGWNPRLEFRVWVGREVRRRGATTMSNG